MRSMKEMQTKTPVAFWFGAAIVIIFAGLIGAAVLKGPQIGWTGDKLLAIALGLLALGLLLLIFVRFFEAILLKIAAMRAVQWVFNYDRRHATVGVAGSSSESAPQADERARALRDALLQSGGIGGKDRPWLLLTGDNDLIRRLEPEAVEAGWSITADTVLLYSNAANLHFNKDWLRRIYRLRRGRPVDAVVLVMDSAADLRERHRSENHGVQLSHICDSLRWAAPVYVLDVARGMQQDAGNTPVIACELQPRADAESIRMQLLKLRDEAAIRSVSCLPQDVFAQYLGRLSKQLDVRSQPLTDWLGRTLAVPRRSVEAVLFAPAGAADASTGADRPIWRYVGESAKRARGVLTLRHPYVVLGIVISTCATVWTTAMLLAAVQNHHDLRTARQAVQALHTAKANPETRLQALDTLQQHIQRYEHRLQHSAPLFTRFGMNRDAEALTALWKPYAAASHAVLVTPVVQDMEATLVDLSQLQVRGLTDETSRWALDGRDTLKAYLMLAHPERVEPDFLAQQLARHWSTEARITPGRKQDLAERLARFYADHLRAHPDWRVTPRAELVAGARQTLLAVIGERNAVDTIYQTILEGAGRKYPNLTLAALAAGTDTRGLVRATGAVPGVFTRQGYEGYVEAAIEKATRSQDVAHDWVLTDGQAEAAPSSTQPARSDTSADALRDALAQRYFADYAEHWQQFMNGLQWEPATTLPGVVDQLKLLADARQSPVIALMKSLAYQGGAGARKDSLSDTLVAKAQGILGRKDEAPEAVRPDPAGPLGAAFGPVLRLAGQPSTGNTGGSELSLQRYLDRVTAVRLRLQQMTQSADANALARQMAQSLFQGKGSDLADTQAYARLMAASLGAEWAGMGEALFVRPVVQAEQSVLQPAQASLNEAWRRSIALPWQRAFAGRYPFAATANDASLPELARYIRPQSGLINTFLLAELAGVLALQGDQWVPVGSGTGLTFDPAFLKSINTLQRIGAHLLVQGEPRYQFELRPIPTPGLTDTRLTLDRQTLHYYNQRETWQAMSWPVANLQEPRTLLQWQTERAGTNKTLEIEGVWAWVRMLEHARVTPIDSATVQLTFHARPDTGDSSPGMAKPKPETAEPPDSAASLLPRAERVAAPATLVHPIHYQMRTAVGRGPLEALELRDLRLPERIFVDRAAPTSPARAFYPISM
ncbi:type VI secretion protein VasK [Cupriavidus pauculus]|uniref:Type VI secretion protein VasK n=2 Tax=Cupriavidus pauculus TaxID=82633 RepID=A0A3G8H2L0_9BURK|nr:type VI secretion protein VasK [Cupriavidus pauculus]